MSLFGRRVDRRTGEISDGTTRKLWAARSKSTSSNKRVDTIDDAIEAEALWAAVTLIASLGSTVPIAQIAHRGDERVRVDLASIFSDPDPDPSIDDVTFRHQCLMSAATTGNAYGEIIGGPRNPTAISTLEPERAQWSRNRDGVWVVKIDGKERQRWPLGSLWHMAINVPPGRPFGLNPLQAQRETIATALAAKEWGGSYFGQGPMPLWLFHNESTKDPGKTGADRLKARIMEAFDGSRDPVLLPRGIKGEQVKIAANESQFLETQRFAVEQIARVFFGGWAEMIGGATSGESVTYANVEQRVNAFMSLSLMPRYLVPFEKSLSRLAPDQHEIKHKVDAIVRADLAARFASYMTSAQIFRLTGQPVLTNDEIRDLEDRARLTRDEYPLRQPADGRAPTVNV